MQFPPPPRATQLALLLSKLTPSPEDAEQISRLTRQIQWLSVQEAARKHRVLQVLHYTLPRLHPQLAPPRDFIKECEQAFVSTTAANLKLLKTRDELLEALERRGVRAILFKGSLLLDTLYPHPGLRPMGDIDFLIREEEAPEVRSVLVEIGFEELPRICVYELGFRRKSNLVEPHIHFCRPGRYRIDEKGVRKRVRLITGGTYGVEETDHLLILNIHGALNCLTRPGLYYLDIHEMVVSGKIDWSSFQSRADSWRCKTTAAAALAYCHRIMGTEVPNEVVISLAPGLARWFYLSQVSRLNPAKRFLEKPNLWRALVGLPLMDDTLPALRFGARYLFDKMTTRMGTRQKQNTAAG